MEGKYEPYVHFKGSPMSKGVFQFDMWGLNEDDLSGRWPWNDLKQNVKNYGVCIHYLPLKCL
jgi:ribonucleoside-diphosphate reductase alpha chain